MSFLQRIAAADLRLSQRLRVAERPGPLRAASILLAHSGDSPFWLAGLLLVVWQGPKEWQQAAKVYLIGIAATALVVLLLKYLVRRPRPAGEWGDGYRKIDPHSFPSGHAARGAMLAALAAFLGPPLWAVVLIVWALLVALSRVALGVHYLSDVVAGFACGAACGLALALVR